MQFFRLGLIVLLAATGLQACETRPAHLAVEDYLGDFEVTFLDQDSSAFVFPESLKGRPALVTAVYTNCPDVCIMTMANMRRIHTALGADSARVSFATVSFDPERDTPSALRRYAQTWRTGPDWHLLTGDTTATGIFMRRIGVRYRVSQRDTLQSGQAIYSISHTDKALLLDAEGRIVETYGGSAAPVDLVVEDIRALL